MDPWKVLGALAALVGLIRALMGLVKEIQDTLDVLGLCHSKAHTAFYELWFYAFIASMSGGFLWGLFWRASLGGTGNEPHGLWAILWPVLTLVPSFACLGWLHFKYQLLRRREQVLSHCVWLFGVIVGAMVFYDLPLKDQFRGLRDYLLSSTPHYAEFWLVWIWSSLLSLPAFLFLAVLQFGHFGVPITVENVWSTVVKPTGFVVIITSLPVIACLFVYPDLAQARGVMAGIFLRVALFISLFGATQVRHLAAKTKPERI